MAEEAISGLTASNTSPTELGNPTGFSASVAAGENVLYAWDFGDGNTGAGPSPTHVYGAAGTYVATVMASNGAGSAAATTSVTVTGAGTSHTVDIFNFGFNPDPVTIRVGDTVTWVRQEGFHNVVADDGSFSSGPASSSWTEYSHTFTSAGEFRYYCEVHGGPGGTGMSGVVIVQAGDDQPITGLTAANDGPTALGQPTGFTAVRTGGTNVSYQWDFGDGNSAEGAPVSHTYAAPGEYTATLTASNSAGSVQAQTMVQVANAVVDVTNFAFSPDPVTIPAGGTVIWVRREGFHNVMADDGSFTSGPPSSSWTTYSHTFGSPGAFPYYCEAHGSPGGVGMAGTVNVIDLSALDRKVWLPVIRAAP
jgi:plastocyanin